MTIQDKLRVEVGAQLAIGEGDGYSRSLFVAAADRIDALEAALREIVESDSFTDTAAVRLFKEMARKALEDGE